VKGLARPSPLPLFLLRVASVGVFRGTVIGVRVASSAVGLRAFPPLRTWIHQFETISRFPPLLAPACLTDDRIASICRATFVPTWLLLLQAKEAE